MAGAVRHTPEPARLSITPIRATDPVAIDADDPAIWVHPSDKRHSLIIGTDKGEAPHGALYVFNFDGKILQRVGGLQRPNNVDVRQGVHLSNRTLDIAVATERRAHRLRVFQVQGKSPYLTDITGSTHVFAGETGAAAEPMGIGLYVRERDGAVFAIVSRKGGPRHGYLAQYRLTLSPDGKVDAREVRRFGAFSGKKEIEAVCADDALGYVYYADEGYGVRKYPADPEAPSAGNELAVFARQGYQGDHEGIALFTTGRTTGYLISTEQVPGGSRYHVFGREGSPGKPHNHAEIAVLQGTADETDGIEVASGNFGSGFPTGVLIAMNSKARNFLLFPWPGVLR